MLILQKCPCDMRLFLAYIQLNELIRSNHNRYLGTTDPLAKCLLSPVLEHNFIIYLYK